MDCVLLALMQTQDYINDCAAANAYSSSSYPREYSRQKYIVDDRDMPRYARSSSDARRSVPYPPSGPTLSKRGSLRRQPASDMSYPSVVEEPSRRGGRASHESVSTRVTPPLPAPVSSRPRRKSVRFDDVAKTKIQNQRPKTYATDAPPVAISESAKETSRRLFNRKQSDGGRPTARPIVPRSESTHSLNTVRAEMGTSVGLSSRDERYSQRERERDRQDRNHHGSSRRRR